MVVEASSRVRASSGTLAGSQRAVSTTPGRLRFMITGVRYTSRAPTSKRVSITGSQSWGDMSSTVVSIWHMVSSSDPTAGTARASPTKSRMIFGVGRSIVPAP